MGLMKVFSDDKVHYDISLKRCDVEEGQGEGVIWMKEAGTASPT